MATKPQKPTPDFPLFAHSGGVWAKKVCGKLHCFGSWSEPQAALDRYYTWFAGQTRKGKITRRSKSDKPHPEFPLYRHPTGQWAKRVRGKPHYFETDPDAALEKWTKLKDDLLVGRVPLDKRPTPQKGYGDRVFLTHRGVPWEPKAIHDNPIAKEFVKVAKDLKIHRKGVGFYALRHTFQTIGGKTRDKDAVRAIMGHAEASNDMSAVYNEEAPDDDRLLAVTDYVRARLFPPTLANARGMDDERA